DHQFVPILRRAFGHNDSVRIRGKRMRVAPRSAVVEFWYSSPQEFLRIFMREGIAPTLAEVRETFLWLYPNDCWPAGGAYSYDRMYRDVIERQFRLPLAKDKRGRPKKIRTTTSRADS